MAFVITLLIIPCPPNARHTNFHRNHYFCPKRHFEWCFTCWGSHRRSISPQHSWELIRPCPLCPLKSSFDQLEQSPICDLCLAIGLWITRWRIMVLYPQLFVEIPELTTVEFSPIVRDNDLWYSKPANKTLPYEVLYLSLCYDCKRFWFHPLCEVINSND